MSKYVTQGVELDKEPTNVAIREENAAILSADLQAQIFTQKGVITRKKSELKKAEANVTKAEFYLTDDVDVYLDNLKNCWIKRDRAAADLVQAETVLDKLEDIIKLFS